MTEMWAPGVCFVYLRACQPVLAVHFPAQANFVMQRNVKGHPQDRSLLFHNLKDAPLTHFLCVYLPPENSALFRASYYQTRSPVPDSAAPWLYSYLKLVSFVGLELRNLITIPFELHRKPQHHTWPSVNWKKSNWRRRRMCSRHPAKVCPVSDYFL